MSSPKKPEESSKPEDSETLLDSEDESKEEHILAYSSQPASGRLNDETLSRDWAGSMERDDHTDVPSITLDSASTTIGSRQQNLSKCTEECYESVTTEKVNEDGKSESSLSLKSQSCRQRPQGSYRVTNPKSPPENTIEEESDTLSPGSRTRLLSHTRSLNPVGKDERVPDTRRARSEERVISIFGGNADTSCNKSAVHDCDASNSENLPEDFPVLAYEATRMKPGALKRLLVSSEDDDGAANINESTNIGEDDTNKIMGEGTINIKESSNFGRFNLDEVANIGASDVERQSASVNIASHQECVPLRESVRNTGPQQRRGALLRLVMGDEDDNEAGNTSEIANIGVDNMNQIANIRAYNINEILNVVAANIRPLVMQINLNELIPFRRFILNELVPYNRFNLNELVPYNRFNLNELVPYNRFNLNELVPHNRFNLNELVPHNRFNLNELVPHNRFNLNELVPHNRFKLNQLVPHNRFNLNQLVPYNRFNLNELVIFRQFNLIELVPLRLFNRNEFIYYLRFILNEFIPFHRLNRHEFFRFLTFIVDECLLFQRYNPNDVIFPRLIINELEPIHRFILNELCRFCLFNQNEFMYFQRIRNELIVFEMHLNQVNHFRQINRNEVVIEVENVEDSSSADSSPDAESVQHESRDISKDVTEKIETMDTDSD